MTREDELITLEEASKYAQKSLRTMQWAARKGYLKAKRFGRTWATTKRDVDVWLNNPQFHALFGKS